MTPDGHPAGSGHPPPRRDGDVPPRDGGVPPRDDTDQLPIVEDAEPWPDPSGGGSGRAAAVGGVVLVLLVLGLLVVNAAIGRNAEQLAADHAEEAVGVPVDVRLSGWPVGLRLLTGQPVDVRIEARDVPLPDTAAVIDRFELELDEVPVDRDLLAGPEPELHAAEGRFVVELGDEAVQQLVGPVGRIPLVDIELRSGVARLSIARFPVIDATAEVEDGAIVFRPTAPIGGFIQVELRIDELPFGFRADDVEIRRGLLRLSGSATDVRLAPPPG